MQGNEVVVWRAAVKATAAVTAGLDGLLDHDERHRRDALRFEADRAAYTVGHALQRLVLADLLEVAPERLRLSRGAFGKPVLSWPQGRRVWFSLSHTRGEVACAASLHGSVGVDVEQREGDLHAGMLEPFLDLPGSGDDAAGATDCFWYWTALEAFWKAHGCGLSAANPRLQLRSHPDGCMQARAGGDAMFIHRLPAGPRHAAALACPWPHPRLQIREWSPSQTWGHAARPAPACRTLTEDVL